MNRASIKPRAVQSSAVDQLGGGASDSVRLEQTDYSASELSQFAAVLRDALDETDIAVEAVFTDFKVDAVVVEVLAAGEEVDAEDVTSIRALVPGAPIVVRKAPLFTDA